MEALQTGTAIQSPVTPASGIETRTCDAKRVSIASNSAQPFPTSPCDRASGSATSVTKATPPIQWATNTTCKCAGYFDVVDH